jgi:hypothetical protein
MAEIVTKRLVERLERAGFVVNEEAARDRRGGAGARICGLDSKLA